MASVNDVSRGSMRVALWTYPRTRSLPVEFCMGTQKHTAVYHELYYTSYLFGDEIGEDEEDEWPEYSYSAVKAGLETCDADLSVVFVKDMAFSLQGNFNLVPRGFKHTFLIRNPEKAIASLYKAFCGTESRHPEERAIQMSGVQELYEFYVHVTKQLKQPPIIVDSDDLVRFPAQILRKYCGRVGIKYSDSMLTWNKGSEKVAKWPEPLRDAIFMHEDALYSSGFDYNLTSITPSDIASLPPIVKTCIESCKPLYREMWLNRIKPDTVETEI